MMLAWNWMHVLVYSPGPIVFLIGCFLWACSALNAREVRRVEREAMPDEVWVAYSLSEQLARCPVEEWHSLSHGEYKQAMQTEARQTRQYEEKARSYSPGPGEGGTGFSNYVGW